MILCLPLIFLITGSLLIIVSVIITGFLISIKDKKICELEGEIENIKKGLSNAHDAIQRSYQQFSSSEIRLLIIQASTNKINYDPALQEIFKGFIQGLLERYSAAHGVGPSDELFKEWEALAIKGGNGDIKAMSDLSGISSSLVSKWATQHSQNAEVLGEKEIQIKSLKRKVEKYRNWSVTLQIVGLIVVLFKDVVSI